MPIMIHDGKILFEGGKIATSANCCCGPPPDPHIILWYTAQSDGGYYSEITQYYEIIYDENPNAIMYNWYEYDSDEYENRITNYGDNAYYSLAPSKYRFWFNQPTNNIAQIDMADIVGSISVENTDKGEATSINVRVAALDTNWYTLDVESNYLHSWDISNNSLHYAGYNNGDQSGYTGGIILEIELA